MNCLIIDDDPLMVHILETMIADFDFLNLVGSATNVKDAINILEKEPVDLIFLDIEMPNINGLEFLSIFPLNNIQVIIVSSHKKYAVDSYNFKVTDYLLKPVDSTRFYKSVMKAKNESKKPDSPSNIFIKVNSSFLSIQLSDIYYIESIGDYVNFHVINSKYTVHSTLKKIDSILPKEQFMRIHNSYIVRIDKIQKYEDNMVFVHKSFLPISRAQKSKLLEVLNIL